MCGVLPPRPAAGRVRVTAAEAGEPDLYARVT